MQVRSNWRKVLLVIGALGIGVWLYFLQLGTSRTAGSPEPLEDFAPPSVKAYAKTPNTPVSIDVVIDPDGHHYTYTFNSDNTDPILVQIKGTAELTHSATDRQAMSEAGTQGSEGTYTVVGGFGRVAGWRQAGYSVGASEERYTIPTIGTKCSEDTAWDGSTTWYPACNSPDVKTEILELNVKSGALIERANPEPDHVSPLSIDESGDYQEITYSVVGGEFPGGELMLTFPARAKTAREDSLRAGILFGVLGGVVASLLVNWAIRERVPAPDSSRAEVVPAEQVPRHVDPERQLLPPPAAGTKVNDLPSPEHEIGTS